MYIAGSEDIVRTIIQGIRGRIIILRKQQGTRDGRTKLSTAGLGSFTDGFTDID